jgi:hypothetical protein
MVSKLAARGMPTDSLARAQRWRRRHLEPARVAGAKAGSAEPVADVGSDDDAPRDDDLATYKAARAEREQLRAERERLELGRLRGALADLAELTRANFTAWRGLRDRLQAVPARIAHAAAAETDAGRVEQLIAEGIDEVLRTFNPAECLRDPADEDTDE